MKKITSFVLLFCLFTFITVSVEAKNPKKLVVASYNIRYANDGDAEKGNGWQQRCPIIVNLVKFNNFDIIGTQEVLNSQLNDLLTSLEEYSYIGVGREDGKTKGEYAPIFYKKDKFEVLKSGTFWLSTETDHPNKGWDAVLPRVCTWAEFKDKTNKGKIWFFNLHMDHVGVEARKESAKLVLRRIQEMCKKDEIVVFTGDFNVDQTSESYSLLASSDLLKDSFEAAQIRHANNGTFMGFKSNVKTESRIDHIFVSPQVTIERYGILTDAYWHEIDNEKSFKDGNFPKEVSLKKHDLRFPSDHFPLRVELSY